MIERSRSRRTTLFFDANDQIVAGCITPPAAPPPQLSHKT
jgi:hypothetical protein